MSEKTTFIKIDRNILRWRWHKDVNTFCLFINLLIMANIRDNDFRTTTIHRGELATSYKNLSEQTGLSIQQVRTAINHLIETGEIKKTTIKGHCSFTVISILQYDYYQSQSTSYQHSTNNQSTFDRQQSKNIKNIKKGEEDTAHADSPRKRPMTNDEKFDEYIRTHSPGGEKYGQSPNGQFPTNDVIDMAEWKILG